MSSSETRPIPPQQFALAIKDLPLENIYLKAAELQNSISHLLDSNMQMMPFANEGDAVCREAISENDEVIARMEERVRLCREEVEGRGGRWSAHASNEEEEVQVNGHGDIDGVAVTALGEEVRTTDGTRAPSGRLTDEELRRQLEAQMVEEDEDGVHL